MVSIERLLVWLCVFFTVRFRFSWFWSWSFGYKICTLESWEFYMAFIIMRPRIGPTTTSFIRTYIARRADKRRAERPPCRAPDPLVNNPKAITQKLCDDDSLTFIYRPPPTSPSPYSFTTAPASPLLRPRPLPSQQESTDDTTTPPPRTLPPPIRPSAEKVPPARASDEVVAEIRRLRHSDPAVYTRGKLAKQFGCTEGFVGKIAALPKSKRRAMVRMRDEGHAEARMKWSENKTIVRAKRAKRREFW
jgi:hypothetical protein